jgi:electron transfer flavoprotein alpha subunit
MARLLVVGEVAPDGSLTKLSTEVATLARALAAAGGGSATGFVAGSASAATELAAFLDVVQLDRATPADAGATSIAAALAARATRDDVLLLPASPDGRDIAGIVSALTGAGILVNATAVRWEADGPVVTQSAFGGKLITESAFTTSRGIVTVRPNSVTAEPLATAGRVEDAPSPAAPVATLPAAIVVDRVEEAAASASIEDARVIVSGGRGVGGPDGFKLLDDLAAALGGAVGATRAAVDSGWIPYAQQIGQTGKIVKPSLYLALGVSGAIQHKVGMQTSGAIVAINRDPDAPMADFADLYVIGDLFEVGPALLAELRGRPG